MLAAAGIILLLIALNALYVAAEFGAVGARRSRLRRMAEDGHSLAARLLPIVDSPQSLTRYIAASQVGITLSGMILGAYAESSLAPRLTPLLEHYSSLDAEAARSIASIAVLAVLTMFSVILGELVPKTVALRYPTQAALWTTRPMLWSGRIYSWFITIVDGSAAALRRLLGASNATHRHVHSPEEIALLIAESRNGGLLEPQEQVRLHRALRLGLRNAGQLMVPRTRLAALEIATPMRDVLRVAATSPYSRLPVFRGSLDDTVGILHTKRVVTHFLERGRSGTLASLVRPIVRVAESMPADRLLAFLRERRSHQAIVQDDAGRVIGLITLEDVIGELIGTLPDEFKAPRLLPLRLSDGRVRLPGGLPLERACVWVDFAWPSSPATVAAFIASEAGRPLAPGERLEVGGLAVEIESTDATGVTSAIVTPPHLDDQGEPDADAEDRDSSSAQPS